MSDEPAPAMLPPELTLVVAATRNMGIGRGGTLPWTGLKREMAYFARVTKRLPSPTTSTSAAANAVIMGRKTWDSIPPKFRPLKGRINIVISRSHHTGSEQQQQQQRRDPEEGPVWMGSLEQALAYLESARSEAAVGKAFVIGGAQIYGAALRLREARRVLLTRILEPDYECDTFFPLELREDESRPGGWARKSKEELDAWTGETVPEGVQVENGTKYEFQMWERVD